MKYVGLDLIANVGQSVTCRHSFDLCVRAARNRRSSGLYVSYRCR